MTLQIRVDLCSKLRVLRMSAILTCLSRAFFVIVSSLSHCCSCKRLNNDLGPEEGGKGGPSVKFKKSCLFSYYMSRPQLSEQTGRYRLAYESTFTPLITPLRHIEHGMWWGLSAWLTRYLSPSSNEDWPKMGHFTASIIRPLISRCMMLVVLSQDK